MWNEWLDRLRKTPFLDDTWHAAPIRHWLLAGLAALVILMLLSIIRGVIGRHAAARLLQRDTDLTRGIGDLTRATRWWFLTIGSAFLALLPLAVDLPARNAIQSIMVVALLLQSGIWGNALLKLSIARSVRGRLQHDAAGVTTITALGYLGHIALWALVVLLVLDNVGVQVTALVTGLGIGGIAIALAAQNILGDLFASLSIVLDKPFLLGDSLGIDDYQGTVEHIGLKTTRLRGLGGEELILSNSDLLKSRIRNFKRMRERRIEFRLGVTYETPPEKLVRIPEMIQQIIAGAESTRFDRAHFKAFGDSALIFEVVYFVTVPDYLTFVNSQQTINLAIHRRFAEEQIAFAYPTQTLFVHRGAGPLEAPECDPSRSPGRESVRDDATAGA